MIEDNQTPKRPPERLPPGTSKTPWRWIIGAIAAFLLFAMILEQQRPDTSLRMDPGDLGAQICTKEIVYYVEGTAEGADITYQNAQGNTAQGNGLAVPLRNEETGFTGLHIGQVSCGSFVYISAQNTGESGTIECEIKSDGEVIESAESSGEYAIAACSGVVPE
jgi:hypothetical protein